jgi:hypothetical protein
MPRREILSPAQREAGLALHAFYALQCIANRRAHPQNVVAQLGKFKNSGFRGRIRSPSRQIRTATISRLRVRR